MTLGRSIARSGVRLSLAWSCAVLAVVSLATMSSADEPSEEPDWIPSISIELGSGNIGTESSYMHSLGASAPEVQESVQESNGFSSLLFGFRTELLGPVLTRKFGEPRFFGRVGIGVVPSWEDEDTVVADGRPGTLIAGRRGLQPIDIADIRGQGMEVVEKLEGPNANASFGLAFSTPLPQMTESKLRIRPSLEYSFEKITAESFFAAATDLGVGPPAPQCPVDFEPDATPPFSCHTGRDRTRQTEHRLGPGLELELVFPAGDIGVSIFVGTRFLFGLSNGEYQLADPAGLTMSSVRRDRLLIRTAGGLRFSWLGWTK